MIFVIEHENGGPWQVQILVDVEEIDTTKFEPFKKIFLCESMGEATIIVDEIRKERLK